MFISSLFGEGGGGLCSVFKIFFVSITLIDFVDHYILDNARECNVQAGQGTPRTLSYA